MILNFLKRVFRICDRRQFKRVRVPFLLRYTMQEKGVGSITNLHDLSIGGVLFTAAEPPPHGSELDLEVNLPTSEEPLRTSAKVVRVTKVPNMNMYRVATKFNMLRPNDREALRILVERMTHDKRAKGSIDRKKKLWVTHE